MLKFKMLKMGFFLLVSTFPLEIQQFLPLFLRFFHLFLHGVLLFLRG